MHSQHNVLVLQADAGPSCGYDTPVPFMFGVQVLLHISLHRLRKNKTAIRRAGIPMSLLTAFRQELTNFWCVWTELGNRNNPCDRKDLVLQR